MLIFSNATKNVEWNSMSIKWFEMNWAVLKIHQNNSMRYKSGDRKFAMNFNWKKKRRCVVSVWILVRPEWWKKNAIEMKPQRGGVCSKMQSYPNDYKHLFLFKISSEIRNLLIFFSVKKMRAIKRTCVCVIFGYINTLVVFVPVRTCVMCMCLWHKKNMH